MSSIISQKEAATAAKAILDFYPDIPASDPKRFVAGLAALLSTYPAPVIARAVDPRGGVPANVEFLNLAKIKKLLDGWYDEHYQDVQRQRLATTRRLSEPMPDPEAKDRVRTGFAKLSSILKADGLSTMGKTPNEESKSDYVEVEQGVST